MLHQLPYDKNLGDASVRAASADPVEHRMVEIPAGVATLGLSRNSEDFGWDNEYERHTVAVPAIEIDQFMVTNRQYLEFIEAGGYETRAFWNAADWNWKNARQILHPS